MQRTWCHTKAIHLIIMEHSSSLLDLEDIKHFYWALQDIKSQKEQIVNLKYKFNLLPHAEIVNSVMRRLQLLTFAASILQKFLKSCSPTNLYAAFCISCLQMGVNSSVACTYLATTGIKSNVSTNISKSPFQNKYLYSLPKQVNLQNSSGRKVKF